MQRHFLPTMITGLIQTPAYARQALSWPEERSSAAVEEIVNHKVQRQAILRREDKQFVFLLIEAALRWRLLDSAGMAAQIDHITQVAMLTNVRVEIIPLRTRVPVGALNIFVIYDDRLARVESETGLLALRDAAPPTCATTSHSLSIRIPGAALYRLDPQRSPRRWCPF